MKFDPLGLRRCFVEQLRDLRLVAAALRRRPDCAIGAPSDLDSEAYRKRRGVLVVDAAAACRLEELDPDSRALRKADDVYAGTRLPLPRLNAERLRKSVREAVALKSGAARLAAGFDATGGPAAAADAFEQLAATGERSRIVSA
ncbi:MAG: hypothetical protein M3355_08215 [Actinomycetota bacterium]|nr:hypothetical protein [Actinomycetota bacterium]